MKSSSLDAVWEIERTKELCMSSLLDFLNEYSFGSLAVDAQGHIAWIHEKYAAFLGLSGTEEALGRPVEELIPNSRMMEVVATGKPIMLDIMPIRGQSLVVVRMPLIDENGKLFGAFAFALFEKLDQLKPLVSRFSELQSALDKTKKELAQLRSTKYSISNFIGASPASLELKTRARRAAQLDTTVLLLGETGTGKELLAHGIHAASSRANKPFIGINIAAIPETLLEAEFFGVAPGAYTGAERKGREGKFKIADGGTLFLDEVGDMPLQMQAKLLRALQEQEIEPLGANKVVTVDVRIIAATSHNLPDLIAAGKFRSDLYYRLNVLPISLPPLRERTADIDALCEHLLELIALRTGMPQRELNAPARSLLASYEWPGNVRELRNVLEQAGMMTDNQVLDAKDFKSILPTVRDKPKEQSVTVADGKAMGTHTLAEVVAEAEKKLIEATLSAARGNKALVARRLGISRGTLYQKINEFNLSSYI
jgi:transcriptional regulator with PAS, ATPase and Fis domain